MKKVLLLFGIFSLAIVAWWWGWGNTQSVKVVSEHPGYEVSGTPALKSYLQEQKFWEPSGVWNERGQGATKAKALTIKLVREEQEGDRIIVEGETITSMSYQEEGGRITLTIGLDDSVLLKHGRNPGSTVNFALKRAILQAVYRGSEPYESKLKRVSEGAIGGEQIVEVVPKTSASFFQRLIAYLVPKALAQYTWDCGVPSTDYRCSGGSNNNASCNPSESGECQGGSCVANEVCTLPYIEESSTQCTQGCPPGRCYAGGCSGGGGGGSCPGECRQGSSCGVVV